MLESHRQEIAKLEALYASNPSGRVFVHLAEALRKGGEYERARNILQEGLARHPDSASGFVVLGRLLIDMGKPGEAEGAFRQVLDLDGGNLVALRCLGDLARENGRRTDAIGLYRELLARNPSSDDVAVLLRQLESEPAVSADDAVADAGAPGTEATEEPAATVAPGRMEATPAEPEFGVVEPAALPGEADEFDGVTALDYATIHEPSDAESPLEDDIVSLIESSAAPLELEEFEQAIAAAPVEINPLSAAPELETPVELESARFESEPTPAGDEPEAEAAIFEEVTPEALADEALLEVSVPETADAFAEPAFDAASMIGQEDVYDTGVPDEADVYADSTELPVSDQWAEETPPVYAETVDVSDMNIEHTETYEGTAADLAALAPTAEFAIEETTSQFMEPDAVYDENELESIDTVLSAEPSAEAMPPEDIAIQSTDQRDTWGLVPEPESSKAEAVAQPVPVEPLEPAWANEVVEDTEEETAAYDAWSIEPSLPSEPAAAETLTAPAPSFHQDEVPVAEAAADSDEVVTETLAELYLAQGFTERAAEVYRALLRMRPGDERLHAKLREAESAQPAPEDAGEVWLRGVESAWTGGSSGASGAEATPYAWTEREEREEGVAIRAYLRELIAWGPRDGEIAAPEPEPVRDSDSPYEPEPSHVEAPWDQYQEPLSSQVAETEPWSVLSEAEPEAPALAPADVDEPWSVSSEPLLDDSWGEQDEPWAQVPETPADPWLAPEPTGIDTAPPRASGNPIEDAFNEWFDQSAQPTYHVGVPEPVPAPAFEPEAAGGEAEPGESADDEDEDLEMFRAWLQSLKK